MRPEESWLERSTGEGNGAAAVTKEVIGGKGRRAQRACGVSKKGKSAQGQGVRRKGVGRLGKNGERTGEARKVWRGIKASSE